MKGVLIYDVPTDEKGTYSKIRSKIGQHALRVNLSVWILDWAQKDRVEALIKSIHEEGSHADIRILKFDESSEPELMVMAREALSNQIEHIRVALTKRMKDLQVELTKAEEPAVINAKRRGAILHAKRELATAKTLAFTFNIMQDVDDLYQTSVKMVATELALLNKELSSPVIFVGAGK